MPAQGQDFIYPKDFRIKKIPTNATRLCVGGAGPAVVLIHGYGETGDMWVPLAKELARDYTVVVPDLRGMGLSAIPSNGYDKKWARTSFTPSSALSRRFCSIQDCGQSSNLPD